jgi:hypothetical protein
LIVSDGALEYLPFAALPSPAVGTARAEQETSRGGYRPLIVEHEVTNLPSASILGVLRRELKGQNRHQKLWLSLPIPFLAKLTNAWQRIK